MSKYYALLKAHKGKLLVGGGLATALAACALCGGKHATKKCPHTRKKEAGLLTVALSRWYRARKEKGRRRRKLASSLQVAPQPGAAPTKPKEVSLAKLRRRFAAIDRNLKRGVVTNPLNPVTRISVPKTKLPETAVSRLGFEKVLIAIPEKGQKSLRTYRHPGSNHHIHDHGDHWIIHRDAHSSVGMAMKRTKLKQEGKLEQLKAPHGKKKKVRTPNSLIKGWAQGIHHTLREGVPGGVGYLKSVVTGAPTVSEKVKAGLDGSIKRNVRRWKDLQPKVDAAVK